MTTEGDSRLAVIDLGSNSFRLVVFEAHSSAASRDRRLSSFWRADDPEPPLGAWWKRTDEIYEPVRILAGGGKAAKAALGDHTPAGYVQRARFYSISDEGRLNFARNIASYIVFLAENTGLATAATCAGARALLARYLTLDEMLNDISK